MPEPEDYRTLSDRLGEFLAGRPPHDGVRCEWCGDLLDPDLVDEDELTICPTCADEIDPDKLP